MNETNGTQAAPYRALDMLFRAYVPKLGHRPPFWRPESPAVAPRVYVPAWSWRRPLSTDDGDFLTVLDANGAYLSAAASVEVAHGALRRAGSVPFDSARAGYWLVERHEWPAWDRIMSPLGGRPRGKEPRGAGRAVWVTTPTARLLAQLTESGHWPGIDVLDSWLCDQTVRLRSWAAAIRRDRELARSRACGAPDLDELRCCVWHQKDDAIKTGYAQAVVMFGVPGTSPIHRPDWAHTIRGQSATSNWSKAWAALLAGYPLAGAGHVDELVYPRAAALEMWRRQSHGQPTPIRIDLRGIDLGAYKVKAGSVPAAEWGRAA